MNASLKRQRRTGLFADVRDVRTRFRIATACEPYPLGATWVDATIRCNIGFRAD